jgi:hypothetical protein
MCIANLFELLQNNLKKEIKEELIKKLPDKITKGILKKSKYTLNE